MCLSVGRRHSGRWFYLEYRGRMSLPGISRGRFVSQRGTVLTSTLQTKEDRLRVLLEGQWLVVVSGSIVVVLAAGFGERR